MNTSIPVRFKRNHPDAVLPSYAKPGDAGLDCVCVDFSIEEQFIEYDLGFSVEIPEGYVGLLFPRSSVSKKDLILANSVGIIDSGYRGPVKARFKRLMEISSIGDLLDGEENPVTTLVETAAYYNDREAYLPSKEGEDAFDYVFKVGEKVAQLVIVPFPQIHPSWADELTSSERGVGGFGSTGA